MICLYVSLASDTSTYALRLCKDLGKNMLLCTAVTVLAIVSGSVAQAPRSTNATLYTPLFEQHSNSTPKYRNESHVNSNPLFVALAGKAVHSSSPAKRQSGDNDLPVGMCAPGAPCVNGACCGQVSTPRSIIDTL
jgi:hypothetical protein